MTTISIAESIRANAEEERRRLLDTFVPEDDEELRALKVEAALHRDESSEWARLSGLVDQNLAETDFMRDVMRRALLGRKANDDSWLLIGRVYARDGGPVKGVAGLVVRPHFAPQLIRGKENHSKTEDGKNKGKRLSPTGFTTTADGNPLSVELDNNGEFFLPIGPDDFPAAGDIYLHITGEDGTTELYIDGRKLEALRGGVENFEIHLTT